MGHKNPKGTISITEYKGRIRLRWRFQGERYSLNLLQYNKSNLLKAKRTALHIEQDMENKEFDFTLNKYKGTQEGLQQKEQEIAISVAQYFEEWTTNYRQRNCETDSDYYFLRNAIKSWGEITEANILGIFNAQPYSAKTYNGRLSLLRSFANWLVRKNIWNRNPFEDVSSKRIKKKATKDREPLTEEEITRILEAFKSNTYCPKSSRYQHSHYYPFIYFLLKTGVRPAEAVGLEVGNVDFKEKTICICEVLARTLKGTVAFRVFEALSFLKPYHFCSLPCF